MPADAVLDRPRGIETQILAERLADDLEPRRQAALAKAEAPKQAPRYRRRTERRASAGDSR